MLKRVGQMPPEEVFTRTVFGIIMIGSAFVPWGKWVTGILGVLFLISAFQGFCITCVFYKKFIGKK
ncbi:MAG: DUF2892 domain-containing protein [Candidatus Omnitrophica bacterium]|nr:DUF2892 domain-containing protein [Candidatus Omnitrophota bacterium]